MVQYIILIFIGFKIPNEALDIGIEEYLESGNVCFLEWAEKIENHLPLNYDHYILKVLNDNTRKIFSLKR